MTYFSRNYFNPGFYTPQYFTWGSILPAIYNQGLLLLGIGS